MNRLLFACATLLVLAPSAAPTALAVEQPGRPERREWKDAAPFHLDRNGAGCEARAIREWVRVTCEGWDDAMVVGGSTEGLDLYQGATYGQPPIHIVFPLREGDRRVFQLLRVRPAMRYSPGEVSGGPVVSAQWLAGDPAPLVVVD
jgi:hypothetical protein